MNQSIKQYIDSFGKAREGRREYHSVDLALSVLNSGLCSNYRLNRLYEWLNESRSIPAHVLDFVERYNVEQGKIESKLAEFG